MESKNALENVFTVGELIAYLNKKGENHNYYYHYTTADSLRLILRGGSFWFTRGNSLSMNDYSEPNEMGAREEWNRIFVGSFSFGSTENMAMWALYGVPREDAVRIAIPKKEMLNWLEEIRHGAEYVGGNRFEGFRPTGESFIPGEVSLSDIAYTSNRDRPDYFIQRGDDRLRTIDRPELTGFERDPRLSGYLKTLAWRYENEVRLRVVTPEFTDYEKISVRIPKSLIRSIRVTTGPNYKGSKEFFPPDEDKPLEAAESDYKDMVNYRNICDFCYHGWFEKKPRH